MTRTAKKEQTPRIRKGRLTAAAVRAAARRCETLEQAAERLGCPGLSRRLERSKTLAAAWDRGRLLRRVADVAGQTFVVPEAADTRLGLARGTCAPLYAADRLVREVWDTHRFELNVATERALVERVKTGDPKAVTAVEHLFRPAESADHDVNFRALRPAVMAEAVGIDHRTLNRWHKEHHLPRNADGTYNLAQFVDWLRRWEADKIAGTALAANLNPMQAEKARLYKLQADEAENRLVPRGDVVDLLRARAAWLTQLLGEPTAERWAHDHEGLTAAQLKAAYLEAFTALRQRWGDWPEQIPIPAAAQAKFEEALALLLADDGQECVNGAKGDKVRTVGANHDSPTQRNKNGNEVKGVVGKKQDENRTQLDKK